MKSFSVRVRFSPHIKYSGWTQRKHIDSRQHVIVIQSKDTRLRQFLTFIHECLHIGMYEFRDLFTRKISDSREHYVIERIEWNMKRLVRKYLIKFHPTK